MSKEQTQYCKLLMVDHDMPVLLIEHIIEYYDCSILTSVICHYIINLRIDLLLNAASANRYNFCIT